MVHAACLKHLTLGTREPEQSAALEGRVLPHLTSLTHLALSLVDNPGSCFLRHISTMTGLEGLHIAGPEATINADSLPGIERLTALQDLHLANSELEAAYLRPMTGLTRLALANVTLQPSQLLQLLARLLSLRELSLQAVADGGVEQLSAYSALTASSNLRVLSVDIGCNIPGASFAHVFPAGHTLPHLTSMLLEFGRPFARPPHSTGLAGLAACCPALKSLDLRLGWTTHLGVLLPLTHLTCLTHLQFKDAHCTWRLHDKAPAGSASDVWAQLVQLMTDTCVPDKESEAQHV